jgi:peroxiredoxin
MSKTINFTIAYAVAFALFFALGTFAQTARKESVKVGDTAPDFTLSDNSGKKITLSEEVKDAPVVLVFYRGSWCPFCARQLADLRGLLKDGEKTRLYAISIDAASASNDLIKKIEKDGKGKINYSFLSDTNAQTIDGYGLRDPRYKDEKVDGIPYPTVYVVDENRQIVWAKLEKDYKNRPTNVEIRAAVEKLKAK